MPFDLHRPFDFDHEWNQALKQGKGIVEIKKMLRARSQTSRSDAASPFQKSGSISPITDFRRQVPPQVSPIEQKDKKDFIHIQMDQSHFYLQRDLLIKHQKSEMARLFSQNVN